MKLSTVQQMLKDALDNWDFTPGHWTGNYAGKESLMQELIEGMIDADLSEDHEIINSYIKDEEDFDGLFEYLIVVL